MAKKHYISPNLKHLVSCLKEGKSGASLEGSSRSMKTWSGIDFLIYICSKVENNADIKIIKETYNSFKTTLYDDFNRRLPQYGIPSPFAGKKEVNQFYLFGNKISLLGADSETVLHGVGSDYLFFNEMLDIPEPVFNQLEMRCRKFWWEDHNPKATVHWVYDKICSRPDVGFLKTTFRDNIFISEPERRKILSYQPISASKIAKFLGPEKVGVDKAKQYDIKKNPAKFPKEDIEELIRCINNERNHTADDYMWDVYGEGKRSAPEGLIFRNVTWIDHYPTDIELEYYGSDIGQTSSPSTAVKIGVDRIATEDNTGNMYIECLGYEPTASTIDYARFIGNAFTKQQTVWADCAEPGFIASARTAGYRVMAVKKFPGSISYGIGILKNYRLHIVKNRFYHEVLKEQSNYKYKQVNGISLDEPIDDFNHFWDAVRYAAMSNLRAIK